jgi:hypothetical protein
MVPDGADDSVYRRPAKAGQDAPQIPPLAGQDAGGTMSYVFSSASGLPWKGGALIPLIRSHTRKASRT